MLACAVVRRPRRRLWLFDALRMAEDRCQEGRKKAAPQKPIQQKVPTTAVFGLVDLPLAGHRYLNRQLR